MIDTPVHYIFERVWFTFIMLGNVNDPIISDNNDKSTKG